MLSKNHKSIILTVYGLSCLLVIILSTCSNNSNPETQIRDLIKSAEIMAEEKKSRKLSSLMDENYMDGSGRGKKDITGLIKYYFLRNTSIHILSKINSIEIKDNMTAEVILLTAITGKPIATNNDLLNISGDLFRFEISLKKTGNTWFVINAHWNRAVFDDFL